MTTALLRWLRPHPADVAELEAAQQAEWREGIQANLEARWY